jgi:hypothetical protein
MVKGDIENVDFPAVWEKARQWVPDDLRRYIVKDEMEQVFNYPILNVPEKIVSHDLGKVREFTDALWGIKGQYLIFQNRALNVRKYSGYHVEFHIAD